MDTRCESRSFICQAAGYTTPATIKFQHVPYPCLNDVPGWASHFVKSKTGLLDVICMQHHKIKFV